MRISSQKPGIFSSSSLVFFIILVFSILIMVNNVEAVLTQSQMIRFDEGEEIQFADVRPDKTSLVKFLGIVDGSNFNDGNITMIICNLEAEITQGWYQDDTRGGQSWGITLSPGVIELAPGEKKQFKVVVNVPAETSYNSKGELKVTGTARTFPDGKLYKINDISGMVRINYYYDWNINGKDISKSVEKGSSITYKVDITNMGNGRDIFFQSIENDKKLTNADITVEYPVNADIGEKSSKEIEIIVKTSKNTPAGNYHIELETYPTDIDREAIADDSFYHIRLKLTVEPDLVEKYLFPATGVTFLILGMIISKIFLNNRKKKNAEKNGNGGKIEQDPTPVPAPVPDPASPPVPIAPATPHSEAQRMYNMYY